MQCQYIGNGGNTLYPNLPSSFLEEVGVQFYIFILHKFKFFFDKVQKELECLLERSAIICDVVCVGMQDNLKERKQITCQW
jgi:hypothetical protein